MYVSDKGDRGYVEMARALLKHGADVNIPDEVGDLSGSLLVNDIMFLPRKTLLPCFTLFKRMMIKW